MYKNCRFFLITLPNGQLLFLDKMLNSVLSEHLVICRQFTEIYSSLVNAFWCFRCSLSNLPYTSYTKIYASSFKFCFSIINSSLNIVVKAMECKANLQIVNCANVSWSKRTLFQMSFTILEEPFGSIGFFKVLSYVWCNSFTWAGGLKQKFIREIDKKGRHLDEKTQERDNLTTKYMLRLSYGVKRYVFYVILLHSIFLTIAKENKLWLYFTWDAFKKSTTF